MAGNWKLGTNLKTAAATFGFVTLSACTSLSVESTFLESEPQHAKYVAYHLPKSLVSLRVSGDKNGKVTVSNTTVTMVADPNAKFRLQLIENTLADDQFTIGLNSKGLLSSAKVVNEDKTPDIVTKIGSIAENANKLFALDNSKKNTANPVFSIDLVFDPDDPRQVNYSARRLGKASNHNLQLSIKTIEGDFYYPNNQPQNFSRGELAKEAIAVSKQCEGSICFRTTRPLIVELNSLNGSLISRKIIDVADLTQVSSYDIRRAPCIKKVSELTFSDGILTKLSMNKPSELLGCLSIPASILKTAIGLAS